MNSCITIETLIINAEKQLRNILSIDQARVFVSDSKRKVFIRYFEDSPPAEYPINSGIAGKVYESGQLESLKNSCNSPEFNGLIDLETTLPFIAMPIISIDNKKVGVFEIINPKGMEALKKIHMQLISPLDLEMLEFFS